MCKLEEYSLDDVHADFRKKLNKHRIMINQNYTNLLSIKCSKENGKTTDTSFHCGAGAECSASE